MTKGQEEHYRGLHHYLEAQQVSLNHFHALNHEDYSNLVLCLSSCHLEYLKVSLDCVFDCHSPLARNLWVDTSCCHLGPPFVHCLAKAHYWEHHLVQTLDRWVPHLKLEDLCTLVLSQHLRKLEVHHHTYLSLGPFLRLDPLDQDHRAPLVRCAS